MNKSIQLIKQIERTHRGLGIPILFGNICKLSMISCLFLGEIGTGKGTTIKAIKKDEEDVYDLTMNTITYKELGSRIATAQDKVMTWRFPEWSTMTKYHRELFLTVGATIISDKEFYHEVGERKGVPITIDIKNCNLVAFIGIQPLKMARMMAENENWESLAGDRFMKFSLINPLRNDSIEAIPEYDFNPSPYNNKMPIETPMPLMTRLLDKQVSEERLPLFARRLLRGFASFEGYQKVDINVEIEFVKLFSPYLEVYSDMIYTQDIDEEKTFASGAYRLFLLISRHEGVSIEDVCDKMRVYNKIAKPNKNQNIIQEAYEKMILRHAHFLEAKGYIEIRTNSPTKFYMTPKFTDYFSWYKELVK